MARQPRCRSARPADMSAGTATASCKRGAGWPLTRNRVRDTTRELQRTPFAHGTAQNGRHVDARNTTVDACQRRSSPLSGWLGDAA